MRAARALFLTNGTVVPVGAMVSDQFLKFDGTSLITANPPSGGTPPTGTGFRHVTSGVEDTACSTPSESAGTLALSYATHSNANDHGQNASNSSCEPSGAVSTHAGLTATHGVAGTIAGIANIPNSSYRTVFTSTGSLIATKVAGTYALGCGDPLAVSGTGTLYPQNVFYIDPADYPTVGSLTTKLRVRVGLFINATAPTGNYTIGLYAVTKGGGGAGLSIYTVGSAVSSGTVTQNTPSGSTAYNLTTADFAMPSAGWYCMACVTTATVATSSLVHIVAWLQMRNT